MFKNKGFLIFSINFLLGIGILAFYVYWNFLPTWQFLFPPPPQEVIASCNVSHPPYILYQAPVNQLFISNLQGENLQQIPLGKNPVTSFNPLDIANYSFVPSPDGNKIAVFNGKSLYVKCAYTKGYYAVPLPPDTLSLKYITPYASKITWSPDSTQLLLNYQGSLVTLNADARSYAILKKNVAFIDNHVNPQKEAQEHSYSNPYTIGDAFWAQNGSMYYSAFKGNTVSLSRYNPQDNTDTNIFTTNKNVYINSVSPNGRVLVLYNETLSDKDRDPNAKRSDYLYFVDTKKTVLLNTVYSGYAWSKDGKYLLLSNDNNNISSKEVNPTYVMDITTLQKTDLTPLVTRTLTAKNLLSPNEFVAVKGAGFNNNAVLVQILVYNTKDFRADQEGNPYVISPSRQINAFVTLSASMQELQQYTTEQGILTPLAIINP